MIVTTLVEITSKELNTETIKRDENISRVGWRNIKFGEFFFI